MNENILNYWLAQSKKRQEVQDPLSRRTGYYVIKRRLNNGKFSQDEEIAYWMREYDKYYGRWLYVGSDTPSFLEYCAQDNLILKKIENFQKEN